MTPAVSGAPAAEPDEDDEDDPPPDRDPAWDDEPAPDPWTELPFLSGGLAVAAGVEEVVVVEGVGDAVDGLGEGEGESETDAEGESEVEGDGSAWSLPLALGWQPVRTSSAVAATAAAGREARRRARTRITEGHILTTREGNGMETRSVRTADLMPLSPL